MILPHLRTPAVAVVCSVALLLSSCGGPSNNKGKIDGRWKMVSASKQDPNMAALKQAGVAMGFEYKPDGTFSVFFVEDNNTPQAKLATQLANNELKGKDFSGQYTLASGDRVNYTGAKDMFNGKKATSNVTISGDNMTMKDPDGTTMQLVRVPAP